ncbi:uncharacterized protein MELLADRAFT_85378 [Melampsora larici-populina 98AG31]|uniref:Carbamoyl phosphate synthase ATP-binding domain-containing protein n=1 Tax=Melampsora larici-populina (strain 98AG31 / pathotype 3-4-7) TaxID=747676 RepID=F4RIH3_MELLP|nr:uncharacterized protein MELLADRAFT_85378 [Melampsora larici-populina 98AG31]EGG07565.1 hypothetical protein MELLADRAFT_85378 [Melampsora larici-populina 98AG31]
MIIVAGGQPDSVFNSSDDLVKLAGAACHLEVQVLVDQYGNAISLFGRDCSVQRHHQKIIEDAPVTIAPTDTFEQMEKAASLYKASTDNFYFLELKPHLQVKHPTTEMVSGVNLPAAQLQIAMGIPLHQIRYISTLHVVAVRAENSGQAFKPSSGKLQRLNFSSEMNVWGYFSVGTAGGLHEFADSQVKFFGIHKKTNQKIRLKSQKL